MCEPDEVVGFDRRRRRLLKASALIAGSAVAGVLPYERPELKSFFGVRSAWAQPSAVPSLLLGGALGRGSPGSSENTGSDWWRLSVPNASTRMTISATSDVFLDLELFLFAPGVDPTIGTNLLTGSFAPWNLQGQGGGESVTLALNGPGNYVLVVEDARAPRDEIAGVYSIVITADQTLGKAVQIEDERTEIQAPGTSDRLGPKEPTRVGGPS